MSDQEFKTFMRAALKNYYLAFLKHPQQAKLTIQADPTNTWVELQLAQRDLDKITLTVGLKAHLSGVFNRLSGDVDGRKPLGLSVTLV